MSGFFSRMLADLFVADTPENAPTAKPTTPKADDDLRQVGQGAANETIVQIAGVPNLFVNEGDHVVQFEPAFDAQIVDTDFGTKMVPELIPHWAQVAVHRCPLKEAIATAIRSHGSRNAGPASAAHTDAQASADDQSFAANSDSRAERRSASPRRETGDHDSGFMAAVTGRIIGWGEERFPRRKGSGPRFYESFALRLDTATGEQVLQGEGLKDAIAECKCELGDRVSVRRVRKVKVQAFHKASGEPKIVDGKPVMWDKWIWSITR